MSRAQQFLIEATKPGLVLIGFPRPSEAGGSKGLLRLRIGHVPAINMKRLELSPPTAADVFDEFRIVERTKKLKRMLFAVLFPHEQKR